MDTLKSRLHTTCLDFIEAKIVGMQQLLVSIAEAKEGETKSSAGDKFETTHAMLEMEEENYSRQMVQLVAIKNTLTQVARRVGIDVIGPGNLVVTKKQRYYLSAALGKIRLDDQDYFCISTEAPIGKLLLGKEVGDTISFNGMVDEVVQIF